MTTTPPIRPVTEPTGAYAARGRRQKAAVLVVATLLGIWLGTSAPGVSPVATTPVPVTQNAVTQDPAAQNPAPAGFATAGRRR